MIILGLTACKEKEEDCSKSDPPFWGTTSIDKDIITDADLNLFDTLSYTGQGERVMYDRRVPAFITLNPFLFAATYKDGLSIEFQVNAEFGTAEEAEVYAAKYAKALGLIPTFLRKDVQTSWIHKGQELFGGGNNNILIYPEFSENNYENESILEETLVHEGSHTSLDAYHAYADGWVDAQAKDCKFISTYARDNPQREDIAESFLAYFAVRFRADRIDETLKATIEETIPHRIEYFDAQGCNP